MLKPLQEWWPVASVLLATAGCGSAFSTAAPTSDGGAPDSSVGGDGGAGDAVGSDGAACGAGTLCVNVRVEPSAVLPAYEGPTGAISLGLDGNGTVVVSIYSSDPGAPGFSSPPAYEFHFPPDGKKQVNVSKLPVTVEGKLAPGAYWYAAAFEDNSAPRTPGLSGRMIGDFISVPSLDSSDVVSYPKITMGLAGQIVDVSIKPVRVLNLNASAGPGLVTAAATNPNIHGDGPGVFILYSGMLGASAVYLDVGGECLKLDVHGTSNAAATFPTTVTGMANIFGEILDYGTVTHTGQTFPPGTIYTATNPASTVNIMAGSWASQGNVTFDADYMPPPATTVAVDDCSCPLTSTCK